ncbi:MAG: WYL domain-containing protein, partial [Gemmatimonadota bacterium]|nr:WYL domain-containing protein [Gemmatimonadota bacterium]
MPTDRITKTQRWLDLLAFLLGRRTPATVDELFAAVPAYGTARPDGSATSADSVRRMFERDKDELRAAGIPIETEQFVVAYGGELAEGYRLRAAEFYLPSVSVGDGLDSLPRRNSREQRFAVAAEDLEETLDALRAALTIADSPFAADTRSALGKLSFDLDSMDDHLPMLRVVGTFQPDLPSTLDVLSDALLRRKRVSFSYRSPDREQSLAREIAPYGILFEMGAWYVVGHDSLRDDIRVFRADRVEKPIVNRKRPGTADFEIPEEFSLEIYRDRKAWQVGDGDE